MRALLFFFSAVLTTTATAAFAQQPPKLQPAQPLTKMSSPSSIVLTPRAQGDEIIRENLKAAGALYYAAMFEEMKLFDVADKVVDQFQAGQLPIIKRGSSGESLILGYAKARPTRVSKANREEFVSFVSSLVRSTFNAIVHSSIKQMEAYADLVRSVSESVDQFARDNTSESDERDYLSKKYPDSSWKAATDLAESFTEYGYGAAQFAARDLEQQIKDALALLADPAVQEAHGAKSTWDVIGKAAPGGKTSAAEAEKLAKRGEAGRALIDSLADNADLLKAGEAKRRELARKLAASSGKSSKAWLAIKPASPAENSPVKIYRPLCYDDKRNIVPCIVNKKS